MVSLRVGRWYDYPRVCAWLFLLLPFYVLFGGYVWLVDALRGARESARGLVIQGFAVVICAGVLVALALAIVMGVIHRVRSRRRRNELLADPHPPLSQAGSLSSFTG
jgi:hypothetical protein